MQPVLSLLNILFQQFLFSAQFYGTGGIFTHNMSIFDAYFFLIFQKGLN